MKKSIRLLFYWYLLGFFLGIIGANLLFKETGSPSGFLAVYGTVASKEFINSKALFEYLLFHRGIYFLFICLTGVTYIGFFIVTLSLLWFGFLAGNLLTIFTLEYGLKGLMAGIVCFIPQILFYLPGWLLLFYLVMLISKKIWKKREKENIDYGVYAFYCLGAGICILLGIWLESYVNQNFLSWIFKYWV